VARGGDRLEKKKREEEKEDPQTPNLPWAPYDNLKERKSPTSEQGELTKKKKRGCRQNEEALEQRGKVKEKEKVIRGERGVLARERADEGLYSY